MPRDSIARITVRRGDEVVSRGTGFLVVGGVVLTALHVVGNRRSDPVELHDGEIWLEFPGHETRATVEHTDRELDWASLRPETVPSVTALTIAELKRSDTPWRGYGWPDAQSLDGMTVHGSVTNHDARIGGQPALQIFCEEAAAGRGMKMKGLSGGPVLCDGVVVGLARFALMSDERSEAGTFYATPIQYVARALGLSVRSLAVPDADPNLQLLVGRVKQFWVEGVLTRSLHDAGLIELAKENRPDAVENPWEAVVRTSEESSQVVPAGTTVVDVFLDLQRSMLVLGEPGSGKTTTLLELAVGLLDRFERDPTQPVPVVFPLSTWRPGHPSLEAWIEHELSAKYQIPARISRPWLEASRLDILLDGLDELDEARRAECVEEINAFRGDYGLTGIVVTSRTTEYERLPTRLRIDGATCLQPLSADQIDTYVEQGGASLSGLREALRDDPILQGLARSPLMLNVMSLAYRGLSPSEMTARETPELRRDHLFDTFIDRMFKEHKAQDRADVTAALSRLARGLIARERTVFFIEDLQPNWLPDRTRRAFYLPAVITAMGLVIAGVVSVFWMAPNIFLKEQPEDWIRGKELAGWLVAMPLWLAGVAWWESRRTPYPRVPQLRRATTDAVVYCLLWVPLVIASGRIFEQFEWHLVACPVVAMMVAVLGSRRALIHSIACTEALGFRMPGAYVGAMWGIIPGVGMGVVAYAKLTEPQTEDSVKRTFEEVGIVPALGVALVGILVGAIIGGLRSRVVKGKTVPNQGMVLSFRTSMRVGLAGLVPAAVAPLILQFIAPELVARSAIVSFVTAFATLALWFGGLDVIKHYILRSVIALSGEGPFRWPVLLSRARRLGFMRRVGSGYLFIHRLLLEHFASLDASASSKGEPS